MQSLLPRERSYQLGLSNSLSAGQGANTTTGVKKEKLRPDFPGLFQPHQPRRARLPKEHSVPKTCPAQQEQTGWQPEEREAGAGNANYAETGSTCSSPRARPQRWGKAAGSCPGPAGKEESPALLPALAGACWRVLGAGRVCWEEAERLGHKLSAQQFRLNINGPTLSNPRAGWGSKPQPASQRQSSACKGSPPSPRAGAGWVSTQAALKSLPREMHLPPAQAAPACPCRALVTTGSSTVPLCPAQPRQGQETPGLPHSSQFTAPQSRSPLLCSPTWPWGMCSSALRTVLFQAVVSIT